MASPSLDHLAAQSIVKHYAQRMTIEEPFRNTKDLRWGQGLQTTRSRSSARLQLLLLIAHLASFVQRLIGEDVMGRVSSSCSSARPIAQAARKYRS